jgi:glycosyltransferase involved in cell wall biosynthesis
VHLLFVKHSLAWPRSSGHDVHCFHMMKALAELGARVSLLTVAPLDPRAIEGVALSQTAVLSSGATAARAPLLTPLQERFRSYFGVAPEHIAHVRDAANRLGADAVVAVGLEVLPYLAAVEQAVRVWYAADEWVYHHLSCVRGPDRQSWAHLKEAAVKGAYERAFSRVVDRVWVVSDTERRAARWFGGFAAADVLPNGVDADYFQQTGDAETADTAIFWGRLDFQPNLSALTWFCNRVWPAVLRERPGARFTIAGFHPVAEVEALTCSPGVELRRDVADLRPLVTQHAVVVLPFVSGGGIKNKLLEAAALAKPIVCTSRAASGLRCREASGIVVVDAEADWPRALVDLWNDPARRQRSGAAARQWVVDHHSWSATAGDALSAIERSAAPPRYAASSAPGRT